MFFQFGILLLQLTYFPISGALSSSYGRNFVVCFMTNDNANNSVAPELQIFTPSLDPVTVTVSAPGRPDLFPEATLSVYRERPAKVQVPADFRIKQGPVHIQNKALVVRSKGMISVVGINKGVHTTDSFLALPVSALGRGYYTLNVKDQFGGSPTEFAIVATDKKSRLKVTLPSREGVRVVAGQHEYGPGATLKVQLKPFHVLQIQCEADLTGTRIEATEKVAVFSGAALAAVEGASCDHVVEQLPPVEHWGKHFVVVPPHIDETGGLLKFVAAEADTSVEVLVTSRDEVHVVKLMFAGQSATLELGKPEDILVVKATRPILVAAVTRSYMAHAAPGDPSMMLVTPTEHYIDFYTLKSPRPGFPGSDRYTSYLVIVCRKGDEKHILIDGPDMTSLYDPIWRPAGQSGYMVAVLTFHLHDVYTVKANGKHVRFGTWHYGYIPYESYGHPGAMLFVDEHEEVPTVVPPEKDDSDIRLRSEGEANSDIQPISETLMNPASLATIHPMAAKVIAITMAIGVVAVVIVLKVVACIYTMKQSSL